MLVLDTSALSAVMHGMSGPVSRLAAEPPNEVVLVGPVAAEISFGARLATLNTQHMARLEGLAVED